MNSTLHQSPTQFLLYQTEDNETHVEVRLWDETVWLNQLQMAELFQTTKQNVSQHIANVFEEGELEQDSVVKDFFTTAVDGKNYKVSHYNLDVIISVGYRVKSHRGTQFRIWATKRLREYIVKGFALDDARLKKGDGNGSYFDELLARIRDIRSSERNFYRKVQDIYTTSVDYDPGSELTQKFFATVQNKLHWAVVGKTAAEIVHDRADSSKPHMGLSSWSGPSLKRSDVVIAKNYLSQDEVTILNLLVSQYLDFAELQALSRKPMHMSTWIEKLDAFLRLNDKEILENAGRISAQMAEELAAREYEKYRQSILSTDTNVTHPDFDKIAKRLESEKKKS